MKVKIMKKTMAAVLAVLILTGGCSRLNPFVKESTETEARFEPNKFLWQAAKDKLSFLKIVSEDKERGVMTSNWGRVNNIADEEFEIEVKVLSTSLRSDCLQATVYKRVWQGNQWVEESANPQLNEEVENAILNQARILYRKSLAIH